MINNSVKTVILGNIIAILNNCFLFECTLKCNFIPVMEKLNFQFIIINVENSYTVVPY